MTKVVVTLRSAPVASVEFPEGVERSAFGAIRLFPGVPRAVSLSELKHIRAAEPGVFARLHVQPYVESRRVDLRGAGEAEVARLAGEEGISHLPHAEQVRVLRERGRLPGGR